jgi:ubiquitin carboxyl-terminal hydrolase L5
MASSVDDGADSEGGWCTIESDPGVFTAMITELGVKGVQVDELVDLSEEAFVAANLACPVFGLIFLFKYDQVLAAPASEPLSTAETPHHLIFSRQVIRNACATQALLAVLLNARQRGLQLGPLLTEYAEFAQALDAETRGELLANARDICAVHNSFSPLRGILLEEDPSLRNLLPREDVFHYVSYVPLGGQVYELDGLQTGPSAVGTFDASLLAPGTPDSKQQLPTAEAQHHNDVAWVCVALRAVRQRISRASNQELRFSVLVVHRDPRPELQVRASGGDQVAASLLAQEEAKHARWQLDTTLRRMDLVPLAIRLLILFADHGHFVELLEEAKRKREQQVANHAEHS